MLKLKVLKDNDTVPLRQVLKGAFDPNIEWLLPTGDVPYTANEAPVGTDHTLLSQEANSPPNFVSFLAGNDAFSGLPTFIFNSFTPENGIVTI